MPKLMPGEFYNISQSDREFNVPLYKQQYEDVRTAKGTKWYRNPNKKSLSKFTASDTSNGPLNLFGRPEHEKKHENVQVPTNYQPHSNEEHSKGLKKDELPQENLLEIPKALPKSLYSSDLTSCEHDKGCKIGFYIRSFK